MPNGARSRASGSSSVLIRRPLFSREGTEPVEIYGVAKLREEEDGVRAGSHLAPLSETGQTQAAGVGSEFIHGAG